MRIILSIALLALLSASGANAAEVHKCVKAGRTTYQSDPCEGPIAATQPRPSRASTLPGCYVAEVSGLKDGFEIKWEKNNAYRLNVTGGADRQTLAMKAATPEEMKEVGKALGLFLTDGVSVNWEDDSPNQKPIGVYKGMDGNGKEIVIAYFFLGAGLATKGPCK
ncbi:MAG: hypothetical protein ABI569_01495 [Casimicrobiaceae bacterium]